MLELGVEEEQSLQQELSKGEVVLWTGKPNRSILFHKSDLFLVPFSLMWGGFALFWEHGVTTDKAPGFFMLWGIPFVVAGQYLIWGRFVYAAWRKKRILYALTNRRALVIVGNPWAKTISAFLRSVPTVQKEIGSNGIGTVTFGMPPQFNSRQQSWDGLQLSAGIPVFVDIDGASEVFAIAEKTREELAVDA